ncbi:MAG: hypothetical protein RL518_1161 [Pseudomonadota bacterium]
MKIAIAQTEAEVRACFPVMRELRMHLIEAEFPERVQRQSLHGFKLAYAEVDGEIKSVAGYRVSECLGCGRYMYVDDFITSEGARRKGLGERLLKWLIETAKAEGCTHVMLDSAVFRSASHELYKKLGMKETCRHFELDLSTVSA